MKQTGKKINSICRNGIKISVGAQAPIHFWVAEQLLKHKIHFQIEVFSGKFLRGNKWIDFIKAE
jgi:hypothetical protein